MKRNGTRLASGGGIRAKRVIALILSIAMALAMLCATAEDSDVEWMAGEAVYSDAQEIAIGDDAVEEGDMDLELAEDAALDVEALPGDELILDGLENNLDADGLAELDIGVEAPAEARTSNESSPEDFEIDENGVLVKYVGAGGDVAIPDGVISIGNSAFDECYNLTSVTIPNSVTNIGERAFCYCVDLTSVTIPDSVTSIGSSAFFGCRGLTSVTVGKNVSIDELIGSGLLDNEDIEAFEVTKDNNTYAVKNGVLYTYDMNTLLRCPGSKTSVTIPDSVTSIGDYAFDGCDSLTSVTIPDSVTSLGDRAFFNCRSLTSVTIPNSVTSLGDEAFDDCYSLTSVEIGKGVSVEDLVKSMLLFNDGIETIIASEDSTAIASRNGILYSHDMKTLLRCPVGLKSITIPDSVTNIGEEAFNCCNLVNVTIPDGVVSIGGGSFYECYKLKDVYIPDSVTTIGQYAFHGFSPEDDDWDDWDDWDPLDNGWDDYVDNGKTSANWYKDDPSDYIWELGVTIHAHEGSYAETYAKEEGFAFEPIVDRISLSGAKLTVKDQVYTGKALKPAVTVKYGKKTLKKGADYTVTYKNNKAIGTATVTVKGKGNYTGTAKKTFKINPKAVSGLKLTAGKKKLTVTWKKGSGITGYQLQYGLKKSFSGAKKAAVSKASTVKCTIKNLKKGKIYYVRIRAWKKVGKKTYYSAWSAAKKAKVK